MRSFGNNRRQLDGTVLGAVISSAIGLWLMIELLRQDLLATVILAAAYALLTDAYSTGASLYFHP